MADGSNKGWFRRGTRPAGLAVSHKAAPVVPARNHNTMVVRACGREWVLKSWSPKP